jgi:fucose permease
MPLPEARDGDLQLQSDYIGVYYDTPSIITPRIPFIYLILALAVFAQFSYTTVQECLSTGFDSLLIILSIPNTSTTLTLLSENYVFVTHAAFALGRFIFAPLCLIFPPRTLLLLSFGGYIIFSALTTTLYINIDRLAGLIIVLFFFEGPIWPIIFAISLRRIGKRTKLAGALITTAASGGGLFPFVMWDIQQVSHKTAQYSFIIIVALFAFRAVYPIYLNLEPMARKQVNPVTLSSLEDRQIVHRFWPTDRRSDPSIRRLNKHINAVIV